MQAVILVGGEGTRLRPLTFETPKPMVPLFGVPFLERTIRRLRAAGVTEVLLAAGYLPQAIENHFGSGDRVGVRLRYVVEEMPLGTAGALANLATYIRGPFFMLNGDVLTSLDLAGMLAVHRAHGGIGTLHAIRVDDPSAFGCILSDEHGRVSRFVEKPARGEAPTDEVNAGTYILEPEILAAIPRGRAVSIERETFPQVLASGGALYAHVTDDYWLDVGRPAQYLQAHRDALRGAPAIGESRELNQGGTAYLVGHPTLPRTVRPPAFVGPDVAIAATATIGPNVVLGARCSVGDRAVVEDSVVWDDVVIGADAIVTGAIIATGARIGAGARVTTGAVIGHHATIAAGHTLEPDARVRAEFAPSLGVVRTETTPK